MKYDALVQKVTRLPCFNEVFLGERISQTLRNQLSRWAQQGKLIRLKRGIYALPQEKQKIGCSEIFISNVLYSPSYVSLEFALNFYGLIPERATVVTAVSTHKTKKFQNRMGTFSYRKVKENLFFGYEKVRDEYGHSILIATPQKALLYKLYFDSGFHFDSSYFIENLRLQNFESLDIKKLKLYGEKMKVRKIQKMLPVFINLIKEERKS